MTSVTINIHNHFYGTEYEKVPKEPEELEPKRLHTVTKTEQITTETSMLETYVMKQMIPLFNMKPGGNNNTAYGRYFAKRAREQGLPPSKGYTEEFIRQIKKEKPEWFY